MDKIISILTQNGKHRQYIICSNGGTMIGLQWETAEEMNEKLAGRIKNIRKRRKISQEELSLRSGVSYGSIKRFETTGMISLLSLTKIAIALDCSDEIRRMFSAIPYTSIEEVIHENK